MTPPDTSVAKRHRAVDQIADAVRKMVAPGPLGHERLAGLVEED
jgi:hypothetical protein